MLRGYTELWLAVFVCVLITGGYGAMVVLNQGVPAASELFGHTIGIIGFILMLMTETFYSLRKRVRFAAWGKLSTWLKFHIFMGLGGTVYGSAPHVMEVQRAGRRHHPADDHHRRERIHRALHLHPHPSHARWLGDRRHTFARSIESARDNSWHCGTPFTFPLALRCSFLRLLTLAGRCTTPHFSSRRRA
jgi:hypothetical protein